jgi:hypothetical protein
MAEHTRPDGNDLERAPEEAAIEAWLEDSSIYLTIPGSEPVRQTIDVGIPGRGQPGGAGE